MTDTNIVTLVDVEVRNKLVEIGELCECSNIQRNHIGKLIRDIVELELKKNKLAMLEEIDKEIDCLFELSEKGCPCDCCVQTLRELKQSLGGGQ
jgi:hypothetical protein